MITSFLYCPNCGEYTNCSGQDFTEQPCNICGFFMVFVEDD